MSIPIIEPLLRPAGTMPIRVDDLKSTSTLRVLVLPDLHIPAAPAQTQQLLASRAFLDRHDWVMLLGDVTANYGTPGEYGHVRRFISKLKRPYSVVNGNHEFFFLPADDGSANYGKQWIAGPADVRRELFERFENFYGLESRFDYGTAGGVGFCLLGIDDIGPRDQGLLDDDHWAWFGESLQRMEDQPVVVFAHFPLCDSRLDSIRYYENGRRPYVQPPVDLRRQLAGRTHPTLWFSGHVHFRPMHPLAQPYITDDGVWQIHCPDARGFGRADNQLWQPQPYDGLFVRSILIEAGKSLSVVTTDLNSDRVVACQEFSLRRLSPKP